MSGGDLPPDLGLLTVLRPDGTADPQTDPGLPVSLVLRAYREIRRLRVLDARMILMQRQGRVGFYGACTGQEATPIASALALAPDDWVFPALRESSMMLVRGFPLATYIAQIFGNEADVLKGRNMPSHMAGRAVNQVSWSSCIGPQIPQAVGAAWAAKLKGDKNVVMGFAGDGATSQPDFHAALTFAGVFQVPCVIVCQNNHWAISIPSSQQSAAPTFASKAIAYGMAGVRVDGNDVLAVHLAVRAAAERARGGGGPTLIECVTYRIGAHSSSDDPSRYRDAAEVEAWLKKDPLDRLKRFLVAYGLHDDAREAALQAEVDAEIRAAIAVAEAAPPIERSSLLDDVYAERPWHLREQAAELARAPVAPAHDAGRH